VLYLVEIGQTAAKIRRFSVFQDGVRRHVGLLKFEFFIERL